MRLAIYWMYNMMQPINSGFSYSNDERDRVFNENLVGADMIDFFEAFVEGMTWSSAYQVWQWKTLTKGIGEFEVWVITTSKLTVPQALDSHMTLKLLCLLVRHDDSWLLLLDGHWQYLTFKPTCHTSSLMWNLESKGWQRSQKAYGINHLSIWCNVRC